MCGIVGIAGLSEIQNSEVIIEKMLHSIRHRGPDAEDIMHNSDVMLGHTRLSIIDLSPDGNQPMTGGVGGRFALVYNGEIYNYREIREQLGEWNFSSNTDTEVVLAAYQKWGWKCVRKFNGMFSFAIWDNLKKELFITRDRLGIKPLYYTYNSKRLIFSSEVRGILNSGLIDRKLDLSAFKEYLMYQTVFAPKTLVKDVFQLLPGHYGIYRKNGTLAIEKYWDLESISNLQGVITQSDVHHTLKKLFDKAIKFRMNSDVPFGAFLSGGIDSSIIVAFMAANSPNPINTFSISFEESEFDESAHAKRVADLFNTNHKEILIRGTHFLDYVPAAIDSMDVPSCDGINTYVVSKLTKNEGITVALSGLGGDELFMGYPVHGTIVKFSKVKFIWKMPQFIKLLITQIVSCIFPKVKSDKIKDIIYLDEYSTSKILQILRRVNSSEEAEKLISRNELGTDYTCSNYKGESTSIATQLSISEIGGYTQNILLRDADVMSMANALEIRVPFFDHEFVEYILSLPDSYKLTDRLKGLLLDSLGDNIPKENVDRKKMGFSFPWDAWIRQEMRDFCQSELTYLKSKPFVNPKEIDRVWQEFLNSSESSTTWVNIWSLVVFSAWIRKNNITA